MKYRIVRVVTYNSTPTYYVERKAWYGWTSVFRDFQGLPLIYYNLKTAEDAILDHISGYKVEVIKEVP